MAAKKKTEQHVAEVFTEVYELVPRTVKATGKTGAAKEKAREAGADIPKPKAKRGSKAAY